MKGEGDQPRRRCGNCGPAPTARLLLVLVLGLTFVRAVPALAGAGTASAEPATEGGEAALPFTDDDLRLVACRLRERGPALTMNLLDVYAVGERTWVPLSTLAELLERALEIDVGKGTVTGWSGSEGHTVQLDASAGSCVVAGEIVKLDPADVVLTPMDIYVETRLAEQLLDVTLGLNLSTSILVVTPLQPLPSELRREAEKKLAKAKGRGRTVTEYPIVRDGFSAFELSALDISMDVGVGLGEGGDLEWGGQTSLIAGGELLWMSSRVEWPDLEASTILEPEVLLFREDPDAGLLGPLHLTSVELGDLFLPSSGVLPGALGAGFLLSSYPIDYPDEFTTTVIEGDALPEWTVELYDRTTIVAVTTCDDSGHYRFEDVRLGYGENRYRLVLRGLRGEVREEVRTFNVGSDSTPPGAVYWRVGAQDSEPLFAESLSSGSVPLRGTASIAEIRAGVNRKLSVGGGVATVPAVLGERFVSFAEAYFAVGGLAAASVRLENWDDGERTLESILIGGTPRSNFQVTHDESVVPRPLKAGTLWARGTSLSYTRYVNMGKRENVPLSIGIGREEVKDLGVTWSAGTGFGWTFDRLGVSTTVEWEKSRRAETLDGQILLGGAIKGVEVTGRIQYEVVPDSRVGDITLRARRQLPLGIRLEAEVDHAPGSGETTYSVGAEWTKRLKWQGLTLRPGVQVDIGDQVTVGATLDLTASLGHLPHAGVWKLVESSSAETGALEIFAFDDLDADGMFDEGETPVEGIGIRFGRSTRPGRTDAGGRLLIGGLSPGLPIDVSVAEATLPDIFMVSLQPTVTIIPRAGNVQFMKWPFAMSAGLEGYARLRDDDKLLEVSSVNVELVNSKGEVAARYSTEFDGYFLFDRILPGTYTLRVDPEQAAKLNLAVEGAESVVLPPGELVGGRTLVLTRQ